MAWDSNKEINDLIDYDEWNSMVTDQKSRALDSDLTSHTGSAAIHIDWTNATQDFLTTGTVSAENIAITQNTNALVFVEGYGDVIGVSKITGDLLTLETSAGVSSNKYIGTSEFFGAPLYYVGSGSSQRSWNAIVTSTDGFESGINDSTLATVSAIKDYVDDGLDTKAAAANAMGVVVHGATAGTARPSGYNVITWIGSVEPTNAENDDVWLDVS